jgi:hypothetical protein
MRNNGCYKAKLLIESHPAKHIATFFPSHWSKEQVIEAIIEVYDGFIKNGTKNVIRRKGNICFEGKTLTNHKIHIVCNMNGKILTAYPILE